MAKAENQFAASELRQRSEGELNSLLQTKTEDLHKATFKHALGQLAQTHSLRALRRDIARLRTVLNERDRG